MTRPIRKLASVLGLSAAIFVLGLVVRMELIVSAIALWAIFEEIPGPTPEHGDKKKGMS